MVVSYFELANFCKSVESTGAYFCKHFFELKFTKDSAVKNFINVTSLETKENFSAWLFHNLLIWHQLCIHNGKYFHACIVLDES